jgi:flagellar motor switch protein FliG
LVPIKKVAIFLIIIGVEKGQSIIALMDNGEIKAVVPGIRSLTSISQETQDSVWAEFKELGYDDKMTPSEVLTIIRFLFNGSKISNKC